MGPATTGMDSPCKNIYMEIVAFEPASFWVSISFNLVSFQGVNSHTVSLFDYCFGMFWVKSVDAFRGDNEKLSWPVAFVWDKSWHQKNAQNYAPGTVLSHDRSMEKWCLYIYMNTKNINQMSVNMLWQWILNVIFGSDPGKPTKKGTPMIPCFCWGVINENQGKCGLLVWVFF